jgi:hypothetical protein
LHSDRSAEGVKIRTSPQGSVFDAVLPEYSEIWDLDWEGLERFGQELYRCLFQREDEDLAGAIEEASRRRQEGEKPLPVHLHLCFSPEDAHLLRYPWELINDGSRFLVKEGVVEVIRHLSRSVRCVSEHETRRIPLDVLYVGPRPKDLKPSLSWYEAESVEKVCRSRGRNFFGNVLPPTYEKLGKLLNETTRSILHFDGLGEFVDLCPKCRLVSTGEKVCNQCGGNLQSTACLYFESGEREADPRSADDIGALVARSGISLVVISACYSGAVKDSGISGVYKSIVARIILAGVPAVVGVQSAVGEKDMEKFLESFYRELDASGNLVNAMSHGRWAMVGASSAYWCIPVLYLCG